MALYVTRPRRDEERIGRGLPSADLDDIKVIAEFLKSRFLNHHYHTLRERERERERERVL